MSFLNINSLNDFANGLIKLPESIFNMIVNIINIIERIFVFLRKLLYNVISLDKVLFKLFKMLLKITDKLVKFLLNKGLYLTDLSIWISPVILILYFMFETLYVLTKANFGNYNKYKPVIKKILIFTTILMNIYIYIKLEWNLNFNPFIKKNKILHNKYKTDQISDIKSTIIKINNKRTEDTKINDGNDILNEIQISDGFLIDDTEKPDIRFMPNDNPFLGDMPLIFI